MTRSKAVILAVNFLLMLWWECALWYWYSIQRKGEQIVQAATNNYVKLYPKKYILLDLGSISYFIMTEYQLERCSGILTQIWNRTYEQICTVQYLNHGTVCGISYEYGYTQLHFLFHIFTPVSGYIYLISVNVQYKISFKEFNHEDMGVVGNDINAWIFSFSANNVVWESNSWIQESDEQMSRKK